MQIRHTPLSGGYCGGVPPLPIPNREVKPTCADGTAIQCGRVGRRLLSMKSLRFRKISEAFLFFLLRCFFFSLNISLSRRFRRWRRFFLIDYFSPTDFTDSHRFFSLIIFLMNFHRFSLIFFFFLSFLYFADFDLSVWKDNADFSNSLFFLVGNHWILHIINPTFSRYLKFYRFRFISLLFYHFPHVSVR